MQLLKKSPVLFVCLGRSTLINAPCRHAPKLYEYIEAAYVSYMLYVRARMGFRMQKHNLLLACLLKRGARIIKPNTRDNQVLDMSPPAFTNITNYYSTKRADSARCCAAHDQSLTRNICLDRTSELDAMVA